MRLILDTRESADPHPWLAHFSADVVVERAALETGDLALSVLPDGAVVERKTVPDFLACLGRERERFERELRRSRHLGAFVVIVEGSMHDVLRGGAQAVGAGRGPGVHPNSIVGSVASWSRRYCPFLFCGDVATAAKTAESFLRGQVREAERTAKALAAA